MSIALSPLASWAQTSFQSTHKKASRTARPGTEDVWARPDVHWAEDLVLTPISVEKAYATYAKFAKNPAFTKGNIYDGCYARAHIIALDLGQEDIASDKIVASGSFAISLKQSPNAENVWDYHVATLVLVDTGGSYALTVLDPLLFEGPVEMSAWWNYMLSHAQPGTRSTYKIFSRFTYDPDKKSPRRWRQADINGAYAELERLSGFTP